MALNVTLSLSHSPGPGIEWEHEVRIVRMAKGHRVVARDPYTGRMRTIRRSRRKLTWRTAVADILELKDTWVWGNLRPDIEVNGVEEWQADMLRLAICRIDDAASQEVELLLQLTDAAIERISQRWGRLIANSSLEVVQGLIDVHDETGAVSVIESHVMRATISDAKAPSGWLDRVRSACEAAPGQGPTLAEARSVRDASTFLALAEGPPPRDPSVRALLFRKWVKHVQPTTFERTSWRMGDQPELLAAEWIVKACAKPGELLAAAGSDRPLKSAIKSFTVAVDAFIRGVASSPQASSYTAGLGRQVKVRAASMAKKVRLWVLGEDGAA